jgi:hypothetical protein
MHTIALRDLDAVVNSVKRRPGPRRRPKPILAPADPSKIMRKLLPATAEHPPASLAGRGYNPSSSSTSAKGSVAGTSNDRIAYARILTQQQHAQLQRYSDSSDPDEDEEYGNGNTNGSTNGNTNGYVYGQEQEEEQEAVQEQNGDEFPDGGDSPLSSSHRRRIIADISNSVSDLNDGETAGVVAVLAAAAAAAAAGAAPAKKKRKLAPGTSSSSASSGAYYSGSGGAGSSSSGGVHDASSSMMPPPMAPRAGPGVQQVHKSAFKRDSPAHAMEAARAMVAAAAAAVAQESDPTVNSKDKVRSNDAVSVQVVVVYLQCYAAVVIVAVMYNSSNGCTDV